MKEIHAGFQIAPDAEITIECNPGTADADKLARYRACGIGRISFGLQSVNDGELSLLGRIHTYDDFLLSYRMARNAGFENINIDLMSGLPRQTVTLWEDTLRKTAELGPEHISAYSLIIEEDTPFYEDYAGDLRRMRAGVSPIFLPSEEEEREMYDMTGRLLEEYGFRQYEFSNYARPGKECRHNIGYWNGTYYLGLGLGAASYYKRPDGDLVRTVNTSCLNDYIECDFKPAEVTRISTSDAMEEFMFLGLRMTEGIKKKTFTERFGRDIGDVYGSVIRDFCDKGLMAEDEQTVRLTDRGIDVSNQVMAAFLFD